MKDERRGREVKAVGLRPLSEMLPRLLRQWGASERARDGGLCDRWRDIVGPEIGEHTRPGTYRNGILTVEVDSAPLLAELSTYCREALLDSLRADTGFHGLRALRFRLSG
ncbi:MAG: DUF721 domain-containing protein [Planctomycetes bacterium]|nr:DUF721 domain-containing protein [Planctomycetota bacterium]